MRPPKDKSRKNKIGFLDDHTLDYYRRVYQTITSDIDGEEKELFLNNVFSQLTTEAVRVCQNQTASRFIERLLVDAKPAHIIQLLTAFSSNWTTVSADRFASHVLQDIIALSPKCVLEADNSEGREEKTSTDLVLEFCDFVYENLETVLTDTYGSHILRVLFEVLGGVDVSEDIIRSRISKTQSKDDRQWPKKDNPPEVYSDWFQKIVKKIFSICDVSDHLMDASSSPVYQTVLLILDKRDHEMCQKYMKKIIKKSGLTHKHKEEEDDDKEKVALPPLVQDEVGSYLVEQIVALSASHGNLHKVYCNMFKGRLLYFAIHNRANFVVQKLIDGITEKELFEEVFDEVAKYMEDILAIHHIGILSKMAAGCIRLHTRQEKFVKMLMEAFHCESPQNRQISLAPLLLTLSTYDIYYNTEKAEDESEESVAKPESAPLLNNINYHGSVLVQQLLRFGKTGLIVTSLMELKPVELKTLSCDRCGSHVIDVFCESETVGDKKRDLLVQKLKGLLTDIGCDRNGSRTLEAVWKNCSVKHKTVIAEELSKHEDKLRSSKFGHFLHRNFSISFFKHKRNDWTTEQGMANKKRKLFKDFLSDAGAGSPKVTKVEEKISKPGNTDKTGKARLSVSDHKVKENRKGQVVKTKKDNSEEEDRESEDEEMAMQLLDALVKKHGLEGEEEEDVSKEKKRKKQKSGQTSGHSVVEHKKKKKQWKAK